jgi:hypothetical protein
MGPRVGLSILCGAALSWGCLGPYAQYVGWVVGSPMSMKGGARGLLLWPGVAMMAVDSLTQLALATVCRPKPPQRMGGMGAGAEDATVGARAGHGYYPGWTRPVTHPVLSLCFRGDRGGNRTSRHVRVAPGRFSRHVRVAHGGFEPLPS